jgi:nitroreductase
VAGRTDGNAPGDQAERTSVFWQAGRWGSVVPALWSFMLALRSRGLGTAWTTLTLIREQEVAEILGIPYEKFMQVGMFPIAHTIGLDFRITPRRPATEFIRWNGYHGEES